MAAFDRAALSQILFDGIRELELDLTETQQGQLMDYLALMAKWN
jgi:16S rRNA (guanine527-N7)-methyltransferase